MRSSARRAAPDPLRGLAAAASARRLEAVVVPGPEVLRALGLDLPATGADHAATPRHANLLILVGALPPGLRQAAAVVYAQMPRPRAVLALDCPDIAPLPEAHVSQPATPTGLVEGVRRVRAFLARGASAGQVEPFDPRGATPSDGSDMAVDGEQHGAGHEADGDAHDHAHDHEHGHERHHEHGAGMEFMSMVAMTRDLPRGADGLPMERLRAPFGPLFPGLPGGLRLTLTLAGDTVVAVEAATATGPRPLLPPAGRAAGAFVDHLARLDPLAPVAYRLLACRALESAAGVEPTRAEAASRAAAAERERAASHLGWASQLGRQLGLAWLERRAARLQLALLAAETAQPEPVATAVAALRRRLERTPLLRSRLGGIGPLPPGAAVRGPVARAAGDPRDVRADDPAYLQLGFEPAERSGGDALARLRLRFDEIERSLALASASAGAARLHPADVASATGEGESRVETPRGAALLKLRLDRGRVVEARLDPPSTHHLRLLPELLPELELGDALVVAGSLDLSPWEASAA